MSGPLSHLKVVECSIAMAGPYCGLMLADYGADVVKIEQPNQRRRKPQLAAVL